MPYDSTKKLITPPVSIYDAQLALNTNDDDVGHLCVNSNINKWATFKPYPNGNVETILRDYSCPFGLRTIYKHVNPNTGEVSQSTSTTLQDAINALDMAIIGGYSNPFLADLSMYVKPTGGVGKAYRILDYISTQGIGVAQLRGNPSIHGYQHNAVPQYGYYDQQGHYYGISRGIKVNSDGYIAADEDQDIDVAKADMLGPTFYNIDTRLTWNRAIDNNLCILDWMEAMFSLSTLTNIHHGVVLWTNEGSEALYYVAVHHIPWTGTKGQAIMGLGSLNWNCVEFLTTENVDTDTDFMLLSEWTYNNNNTDWMFIPGMIWTGLHVGNNNPYNIGAYFIRAEVSPYLNVFNLQMRITDLGANSSVQVFLSDNPNPNSIYDFVLNSATSYTASTTGDHYIYGPSNSGVTMYPSDYDPSATGITNRFNQVFTVGSTYYLHIWGKRNPSDSSSTVIWTQPLVATVADSLELLQ